MKRLWLILCLLLITGSVAALGVYRVATLSVTHALERFIAALPPGTTFTYRRARPSFLVRGVTLHDVTFRQGRRAFHARVIRLGHPQYLTHGQLSLSSLLLKDADYGTPQLQLSLERIYFQHLLIPAGRPLLEESDQATASMQSLAEVMRFDPARLATLQFSRLQLLQAAVTFTDNAPSATRSAEMPAPFALKTLTLKDFALEGYGVGTRVQAQLDGLDLTATARLTSLAQLSPVSLPLLLGQPGISQPSLGQPGANQSAVPPTPVAALPSENALQTAPNRPFQLHLDWFTLRDGEMHLLKHPFRGDFHLARRFWQAPAQVLWTDPGNLSWGGLKLRFGTEPDAPQFGVDHMIAIRRQEAANLRTEAQVRGFHFRSNTPLPFPVNGAASTLRFSELSTLPEGGNGQWSSDVSLRLNVREAGEIVVEAQTQAPARLPGFFLAPEDVARRAEKAAFARQSRISSLVISERGDRLIDLIMLALQFRQPDMPASEIRHSLVTTLNQLALTRPLLAPLADYLLNPQNRTLKVAFGALTLEDLHNLPLNSAPEALFDALHLTALTTSLPDR
ncbi:hypothetical protein [Oecophyllibacter saccharovorans]|uniref:DUF748 domain-containing protein n=1 Tax=Oecophyllibacter saccharovorans TaxID=2558360 RepID=A0A506ULH0_9PROT|nr:hypothetical protein [Oecophyllibacter saccharovorans]TPW34207.1 hypothetical protein E3202_06755 [Oecophyllibacter saccharovorans]